MKPVIQVRIEWERSFGQKGYVYRAFFLDLAKNQRKRKNDLVWAECFLIRGVLNSGANRR
jgi:hypothetical protein